MIVKLNEYKLVISAEKPSEATELDDWLITNDEHAMLVSIVEGQCATLELTDLGHHLEYTPKPLNVLYDSGDEQLQIISNLGFTPFHMDGRDYASVEGFWQGLKSGDEKTRRTMAQMHGLEAKRAGNDLSYSERIRYEGEDIIPGTSGHWGLMFRACKEKFHQNVIARDALLNTGNRILIHKPLRDSKTIPGALLADCWMELREQLN